MLLPSQAFPIMSLESNVLALTRIRPHSFAGKMYLKQSSIALQQALHGGFD